VALIALMVLIVLGITGFLVSALNASTNRTVVDRTDNAEALAKAKTALVGWMATNAVESGERNPGRLPCPEAPGYIGDPEREGTAAGSCTLPKIGRLPWRTLGLPKLLDAAGEPLWYVVSPGWAYTSDPLTINSDSVGNLTVDGQANAAVALVVAPGGPVVTSGSAACAARTQQRGPMPPDFCNYLETALDLTVDPAATPLPTPTFSTVGPVSAFNDQVLKITAADLMPALEAAIASRMQRDLAPLLAAASTGSMPGASTTAPFYPFASAWSAAPSSTYAGTIGTSQGLLPLVRSRKYCAPTDAGCNATLRTKDCVEGSGGDEHCDLSTAVRWAVGTGFPNYDSSGNGREWTVTWSDGSKLDIEVTGGTSGSRIGAVYCAIPSYPSTPTQIDCTLYYGLTCGAGSCGTVQPIVTVTARTNTTAGRAFRRYNDALLSALPVTSTFIAGSGAFAWRTGANLGALRVKTDWRLPAASVEWWCDDLCGSTRIQIPSLYVEDDVPLQSRLRDEPEPPSGQTSQTKLYWFLKNDWRRLSYFAVAPAQLPGGSSPCAGLTCLSVDGVAGSLGTQQALLVLAGRALAGAASPRASLADYLEGLNADANLSDPTNPANRVFERRTVDKAFNDRIVFLSPRP
jgi:hypothetical protein